MSLAASALGATEKAVLQIRAAQGWRSTSPHHHPLKPMPFTPNLNRFSAPIAFSGCNAMIEVLPRSCTPNVLRRALAEHLFTRIR
jgi:hypothetical protein